MKIRRMYFGFLLFSLLLLGMTGHAAENGTGSYTIGVAVYNPDSAEMSMFMDYYRNYLQEGFPVKFYFSGMLATAEEENAFIASMKEQGAQGIISFVGRDVPGTVRFCQENEIYYVLGSGFVSDEEYEEVKDNPWFLGTVGPRLEDVYQSGRDMAEYFAGKEARSYVIMTGGAAYGNVLHALRTKGMLEVLSEKAGIVLEQGAEETAQSESVTVLYNEDRSVSVTLCPDYTEEGNGLANLEEAFAAGDCDVLMSAFHASTYLDRIEGKEEEQGKNIMVGAIDSFTEANFEAVKEKDAFGNSPLDYVQGKYASMAGPAFALMYNAISGYPQANTADGQAVRLYQGFWTAKSREEYIELYSYTSGIYENAYSCENLMQVISVFNADASPEAMKDLAEAYTVEDVKARILE